MYLRSALPGVLAVVMAISIAGADTKPPNVVLLVMDTVRWSDVSLADPDLDTTPELAALAEDGVVFANAYATHDWTVPSHFSIFTGLHHRVVPYDVEENSIAYQLRETGYDTFGVCANGLMTDSESFVRPIENYVVPHWKIREQLPQNEAYQERVRELLDYYDAPRTEFSAILALSNAPDIGAIASRMIGQRTENPFFLFVNFMDAHDPYFPLPEYYDVEKEPFVLDFFSDMRTRYIEPWENYVTDKRRLASVREKFRRRCRGLRWLIAVDVGPEQMQLYRQRYRASIRQADAEIGRLVREMKVEGLYDNTVIVVVSDHGESFGEKDYMVHGVGNAGDREATLHVPLLVVTPGTHGKGHVVEEEVSIADVAPTLHALTGIEFDRDPIRGYPNNDYGRNLLPLMGLEADPPQHRFEAMIADSDSNSDSDSKPEADPGGDDDLRGRLEALGYLE